MRTFVIGLSMLFALLCGLSAQASWYWPFDFDPDSTNKPPRLHRLLEKANDYIELAEDSALEGDGDKSIENYRLALRELDRVERENPDRAESPEFAPLRSKRATCLAAIDSIRFSQVNDNERAVAVTDTRDLERKWRKKHGQMTPDDLAAEEREKARQAAEKKQKDSAEGKKTEGQSASPAPSQPKETGDTPERQVVDLIRKGDYAAANKTLDGLLKDRPEDMNLLLLRAAAQSGSGSDYASRRTLEQAVRLHPKSYLPYYNLALISLKLGENAGTARTYYEQGRAAGGPRNEELEKRLK